jgi:putative endonuclease
MRPRGTHNYYVYILTNKAKTVLYTGVTNDLSVRLFQHRTRLNKTSFTSRYNCFNLVYYEHHTYINHALEREKEIKGWRKEKKINLIESLNPSWDLLNYLFDD